VGLFFLSNSIFSQDFQLASNNKTFICDNASVGSSGMVNGKTYAKVKTITLVWMNFEVKFEVIYPGFTKNLVSKIANLRSSIRHKIGPSRSTSLANFILSI